MSVAPKPCVVAVFVALALAAHVLSAGPTVPGVKPRGGGKERTQTVRTVCSQGCDHTSIGTAIVSSQAGDEIAIGPGRYVEHGMLLSIDLTLTGASSGETIVDGNDAGQVFFVEFGADVLIRDLTIQRGAADSAPEFIGGAIRNFGTLTLKNVELRDNRSQQGGGAVHNNGDLTLEGCLVAGNDSPRGAIHNEADVAITTTTITGNEGNAGVNSEGFSVVITQSLIHGNSGHGVYAGYYMTGPVTVASSTVVGNSAEGIFDATLYQVFVTASTIAGNAGAGLFRGWS